MRQVVSLSLVLKFTLYDHLQKMNIGTLSFLKAWHTTQTTYHLYKICIFSSVIVTGLKTEKKKILDSVNQRLYIYVNHRLPDCVTMITNNGQLVLRCRLCDYDYQ